MASSALKATEHKAKFVLERLSDETCSIVTSGGVIKFRPS